MTGGYETTPPFTPPPPLEPEIQRQLSARVELPEPPDALVYRAGRPPEPQALLRDCERTRWGSLCRARWDLQETFTDMDEELVQLVIAIERAAYAASVASMYAAGTPLESDVEPAVDAMRHAARTVLRAVVGFHAD